MKTFLPWLKICFKLVVFLLLFEGCKNKSQDDLIKFTENNIIQRSFSIVDTIELHNDSANFRFSNIEKILSDSLLVFNYPNLDLHFSKRGLNELTFLNKVSDSKEGFRGSFIQPIWNSNNGIIVIEHGNLPMLSFFDPDFQFYNRIKLKDYITENFYLPTISSKAVQYRVGENTVLLMTSESLEFLKNTNDYFSSSYVFLKVVLDQNNNYVSHSFHLKLTEFDEIKNALKSNKRYWSSSIPKFDVYEDKIYTVFEFSNSIFVFDFNFNLERIIPINFYDKSFEPQSTNLNTGVIKDPNESVKLEFLLRHSKPHVVDIKVYADRIILLFNEAVKKDEIPTNIIEENNFLYHSFLHVIENNKDQSEQIYISLADDFSPYEPIFLMNKSIFVYKNYNKSDGYEILEIVLE